MKNNILSKQPYKGANDWYPQDMFLRNYLFNIWTRVAKKYGYEEYDTAQLEDANLYRVKSGEELGEIQLYNFTDKGGREIALRPEMTPSLARMVALKKNELQFPLRWFNIGRYFRYEKPQKGRKREFFQLNIDILGVQDITAEIEIIQFALDVMKELNAPKSSFEIKVSNRYLLDYLFDTLQISKELRAKLARALDNYLKMPANDFKEYLAEIGLNNTQVSQVMEYTKWDIQKLDEIKDKSIGAQQLTELFSKLKALSISNVVFCPYIVRGLAYYTGTVIELYDIGQKDTPRAMFGGGRYDNLLEIFNENKIPAFGLGWGDITTFDFLKRYNLLPEYKSDIKVFVCLMDSSLYIPTAEVATYLRDNNINTVMQITPVKLSKQLQVANSKNIPWVVILGEDELKRGVIQLKDMNSGKSFLIKKEDSIQKIV